MSLSGVSRFVSPVLCLWLDDKLLSGVTRDNLFFTTDRTALLSPVAATSDALTSTSSNTLSKLIFSTISKQLNSAS